MKKKYVSPEVRLYHVDVEHLLNVAVSGEVPDPGSAEAKQGNTDRDEWDSRDDIWDRTNLWSE